MPIHLPPISRRRFLAGSLAATTAALWGDRLVAADKKHNADSFALLSDTHICEDPARVVRNANMAEQMKQCIGQVLAMPDRPAGVLVNGDLALTKGEAKDYAILHDLLKPLSEAGLSTHLTLGNHDHRANFHEVLKLKASTAVSDSDPRHAAVIESPLANWFLLDTLEVTNQTPGLVGQAQLKWLSEALDARTDKPAIIFAHHTHEPFVKTATFGIKDTDALFAALLPRRHVKLFIHGHSHHWRFTSHQDLHIIGLPPTAYVFDPRRPSGWVHALLRGNGASFELHALNPKHPEHGKVTELGWRSDK